MNWMPGLTKNEFYILVTSYQSASYKTTLNLLILMPRKSGLFNFLLTSGCKSTLVKIRFLYLQNCPGLFLLDIDQWQGQKLINGKNYYIPRRKKSYKFKGVWTHEIYEKKKIMAQGGFDPYMSGREDKTLPLSYHDLLPCNDTLITPTTRILWDSF